MYKLDVYDTQGKVLQAYNIEKLLKWVIEDADLDTGNNYKINTIKGKIWMQYTPSYKVMTFCNEKWQYKRGGLSRGWQFIRMAI